jgi:CRP-like cAMP-binding protein
MQSRSPLPVSEQIDAAWRSSLLGGLDEDLQRELKNGAAFLEVPAGHIIYRGSGEPKVALVVSGLVRVMMSSPDGRRATVRYVHSGDFTGLVSVVTHRQVVDSEAVSDSSVLFLDIERFTRLAVSSATLSWAISSAIGSITSEIIDISATNVFGSVRRRVAWHLLDLAQPSEAGLVVQADQQDIADSIGSVREVIARALRGLRDDEYIGRSGSAGMPVLNPSGLHLVATGRE